MPRRRYRVPVVIQAEQAECGLASLAMVAAYYGHKPDLATLRARYAFLHSGPTLRSILSLANAIGLTGRPVRLGLAELGRLSLPAVLHWEFDHFVVMTRHRRRGVDIHDPAVGRRFIAKHELADAFTGVAIEFSRAADFRSDATGRVPLLKKLLSSFKGLTAFLGMMLGLLLVTQLLALAPPVATQLLIDEVVLGQDRRWLFQVLAGVGLIMVTTLLIDVLRRWIALFSGTRLAADSTTAVVEHLLRLPVETVVVRPVGDLLSRIDSLRPIRAALTESCLNGVVQFVIVVTTLGVMAFYSPGLMLLSAAALLTTLCLHALLLPRSRALNLETVVTSAQASNSLIESLRSYRAVQALGLDAQRLSHWQRHFVAATNAGARQGKLRIAESLGQGLIVTVEYLLFLGIGIGGVVDKQITLGVLFAFLSLRGRLNAAATQMMSVGRELFLLRSHIERVGELVAEVPQRPAPAAALRRKVKGTLECCAVSYQYPGREQLFDRYSCSILAGESVVISGPSGIGKSTLLHMLSAGSQPTGGSVLVDGVEVDLWDPRVLRRQFGIVLQQDRLFQGSIADNISCFDSAPDLGRIREVACLAVIWQDIQALPMTVHTQVADGGAALSGGQVQRILIARALYRNQRVLFLDEATSHLDSATEQRVLDNLGKLDMTIISVAHRNNALAKGGRVIRLNTPHNPNNEQASDYECPPD